MLCSTAIFLNIGVLAVDDDLDSFLAAMDVADDGFLALKLTAYAVAWGTIYSACWNRIALHLDILTRFL